LSLLFSGQLFQGPHEDHSLSADGLCHLHRRGEEAHDLQTRPDREVWLQPGSLIEAVLCPRQGIIHDEAELVHQWSGSTADSHVNRNNIHRSRPGGSLNITTPQSQHEHSLIIFPFGGTLRYTSFSSPSSAFKSVKKFRSHLKYARTQRFNATGVRSAKQIMISVDPDRQTRPPIINRLLKRTQDIPASGLNDGIAIENVEVA
jgi:hypothetical protein